MDNDKKNLTEKLISKDNIDNDKWEQYRKGVKKMIEQDVTGVRKLIWIGVGILGVTFLIIFGRAALLAPSGFSNFARCMFIIGALAGLATILLAIWILKKGAINLHHSTLQLRVIWGITVVVMAFLLQSAIKMEDKSEGALIISYGLAFLILISVFSIVHYVKLSELKIREKLLEIELMLAEKKGKEQKSEQG